MWHGNVSTTVITAGKTSRRWRARRSMASHQIDSRWDRCHSVTSSKAEVCTFVEHVEAQRTEGLRASTAEAPLLIQTEDMRSEFESFEYIPSPRELTGTDSLVEDNINGMRGRCT
jgi:hypothetical protein